jgi:fatty-acyl-CoA synthase
MTATPLSPLAFLGRAAQSSGDKIAVVSPGRRLSYREFAAEATRVANALRAWGIRPGDRVAYLSPNTPELLVGCFAVPLAGAVLVTVDPGLSREEVRDVLADSGSRLVVVEESLLDRIGSGTFGLVVIGGPVPPGVRSYADLLAAGSGEPLPWSVADDQAVIAVDCAPGATVTYTHQEACLNALDEIIRSGFDSATVCLCISPRAYGTAWAVASIGGTYVCPPAEDGPEIWRLLEAEGVTHLTTSPGTLAIMGRPDGPRTSGRPKVSC